MSFLIINFENSMKNFKFRNLILYVLSIIALTGCASILSPSKQEIVINTSEESTIILNGDSLATGKNTKITLKA